MSGEPRRSELMARLLGPVGPEVTCEECFDLLDEYVELEVAGADADDPAARDAPASPGLPRLPRGP